MHMSYGFSEKSEMILMAKFLFNNTLHFIVHEAANSIYQFLVGTRAYLQVFYNNF